MRSNSATYEVLGGHTVATVQYFDPEEDYLEFGAGKTPPIQELRKYWAIMEIFKEAYEGKAQLYGYNM